MSENIVVEEELQMKKYCRDNNIPMFPSKCHGEEFSEITTPHAHPCAGCSRWYMHDHDTYFQQKYPHRDYCVSCNFFPQVTMRPINVTIRKGKFEPIMVSEGFMNWFNSQDRFIDNGGQWAEEIDENMIEHYLNPGVPILPETLEYLYWGALHYMSTDVVSSELMLRHVYRNDRIVEIFRAYQYRASDPRAKMSRHRVPRIDCMMHPKITKVMTQLSTVFHSYYYAKMESRYQIPGTPFVLVSPAVATQPQQRIHFDIPSTGFRLPKSSRQNRLRRQKGKAITGEAQMGQGGACEEPEGDGLCNECGGALNFMLQHRKEKNVHFKVNCDFATNHLVVTKDEHEPIELCKLYELWLRPESLVDYVQLRLAESQGLVSSCLNQVKSAFAEVGSFFGVLNRWIASFTEAMKTVKEFISDWWPELMCGLVIVVVASLVTIVRAAHYPKSVISMIEGLGVILITAGAAFAIYDSVKIAKAQSILSNFTSFMFSRSEIRENNVPKLVAASRPLRMVPEDPVQRTFADIMGDVEEDDILNRFLHSPSGPIEPAPHLPPFSFPPSNANYEDDETLDQKIAEDLLRLRTVDVVTGTPQVYGFDSLLSELSEFFSIRTWSYRLHYVSALFRGCKDMSSILSFLFELLPFIVQNKLLGTYPKLLMPLLFHNSNWKDFAANMDRLSGLLKTPTAPLIAEAERLLRTAREYISKHCSEGWANHAENHISKFAQTLENAKNNMKTVLYGRTPIMITVAGPPGIGKTMMTNQLGTFLTGCFLGSCNPYRVYQPPPGEFWENIGDCVGVRFPEFCGTSSEQQLKDIVSWMALADGSFKPNGASLEAKDKVYDFAFVIAASNVLYPTNVPNFSNWSALYRRSDFRIYASIRKDWPQDRTECMAQLATLTAEQQASFPHLEFHLVSPAPVLPRQAAGGVTYSIEVYNRGMNLDTITCPRMAKYCRDMNLDSTKLTFEHLLAVTYQYAKDREDRTKVMVGNQSKFMDDMFKRITGEEPGRVEVPNATPVLDEKEKKIFDILLALTITVPVAVLLGNMAKTCYNFLKEKNEYERLTAGYEKDKMATPEYGGRPRGAHLVNKARILSRLRGKPQGTIAEDPCEIFADRLTRGICKITNEDTNMTVHGFLVDSQTLLTVSHIFRDSEGKIQWGQFLNVQYPMGNGYISKLIEVHEKNIQLPQGPENDVALVRFDQPVPGVRKSTGFFLPKAELGRLGRQEVTMEKIGHSLTGMSRTSARSLRYDGMPGLRQKDVIVYAVRSQSGDCGSPVWAMVNGQPRIVGIHVAGVPSGDGVFTLIAQDDFSKCTWENIQMLDLSGTVQSGFLPPLFVEGEGEIPEGNFAQLSLLTRPVVGNTRSQLKPTPYKDSVPDLPCRVAPAVLDSRIIPLMEKKYGILRRPIPLDKLQWAEMASDYLYPAPTEALKEWSLETAVNAIPPDASVGFGWTCKRKDLIPLVDGKHVAVPLLRETIDVLIKFIDGGTIPLTVIQPCLKDETLKLQKIIDRKTRTFQISRFELLVFGTMVLGDYMEYMHSDPISTPSTVGLDPASQEWDALFRPLLDWSEDGIYLVDLDYAAMEATLLWQMFESYLRHTTRYYKDFGEKTWFRRRAYLLMMCQSAMAVGQVVYYRDHGNPSGMKGTTDINTYAATIFAAYAFYDNIPVANPSDYASYVASKFNGDDTVLAVAEEVRECFNFLTVEKSLAKLNVVITPAKKDSKPTPNIEQTEVQFCKKQILYSEELSRLVPFVSFWTLLDQLSYARWKNDTDLVQIVNSALQWSFFRGRNAVNGQIPVEEPTFDVQRKFFLKPIPIDLHHKVVTYEELAHRYMHPRAIVPQLQWVDEIRTDSYFTQTDVDELYGEPHSVMENFSKIPMNTTTQSHIEMPSLANIRVWQVSAPTGTNVDLTLDPYIIGNAQFGFDLGPIHLGFGEESDTHSDVNPAPVPPSAPSGFQPVGVEAILDTAVDILDGVLQSGTTEQVSRLEEANEIVGQPQSKTLSTPATAVRDGELFHPGFNAPNVAVNLDDNANSSRMLKPEHALHKLDELSHDHFAHLPVIIKKQTIANAWTAPSVIYQRTCSPFDIAQPLSDEGTAYYITPLEFLARCHAYWHGGLRLRFALFGPREYSVRIAICTVYGRKLSDGLTYEQEIQYPTVYHTFDSSSREITVEMSDVNPFKWKLRPDLSLLDTLGDKIRFSNGYIRVWQVSAPTGINVDLTSDPYVVVWLSGASDFQVQRFAPMPNMFTQSMAPTFLNKKEVERLIEEDDDGIEIIGKAQSGPATDITAELTGKVPAEEKVFAAPPDIQDSGTAIEAIAPQVAPAIEKPLGVVKIRNTTTKKIELTHLGAKFFQQEIFTLSITDSGLIKSYAVPTAFIKAQPALIIKTGRYFRGDLRVRFTVTSSAFSMGNYIAYFVPYGVNYSEDNLLRASSLPHVEIDASSNKPVDMLIPYTYYADYYDADQLASNEMPGLGRLNIFALGFAQPVTTPKPITLNVQFRWENLETFVPITVPPCVTTFDAPEVVRSESARRALRNFRPGQFRSQKLPKTPVVKGKPQSGKGGKVAQIENINTMTSRDKSVTHQEQRHKKAIAPITINKIPKMSSSFVDEFFRPSLFFAKKITLSMGTPRYGITLPNLLQSSDSSGAGQGNIFDTLKAMFAGYAGDARYDIIVRMISGTSSVGVTVGSIVSTTEIDYEGLVPQIPVPYLSTDHWPSRIGIVAPTDSFVVGSQLPLTSFQLPGKISVHVPFKSQTRYVPAQQWENGNALDQTSVRGFCVFWNNAAEDAILYVEIWRNPVLGSRFTHWTGMPPVFYDSLFNGTETPPMINYAGTFVTLP